MIFEYRSLSSCYHHSTMVDCFYFNIFLFMDMLDIDSLVDSLIHRLSDHILELSGATPICSTLNYWLFSPFQLQGQIGWHTFGPETDRSCVEAKQIFGFTLSRSSGLLCVDHIATFLCQQWQTSHKGQQSLTKLNAKQVAYKSGSFLSLKDKSTKL